MIVLPTRTFALSAASRSFYSRSESYLHVMRLMKFSSILSVRRFLKLGRQPEQHPSSVILRWPPMTLMGTLCSGTRCSRWMRTSMCRRFVPVPLFDQIRSSPQSRSCGTTRRSTASYWDSGSTCTHGPTGDRIMAMRPSPTAAIYHGSIARECRSMSCVATPP